MSTTIDIENAKQIRQPMQIEITLDGIQPDQNITVSGSNYKIADFASINKQYTVRTLADLQGDGFELDGTHVLYDSVITASDVNGKIGIRGNIGEQLIVHVQGSGLAAITIPVTGCEYAACDGQTFYPDSSGNILINVSSSSAKTISFYPASETERIEIAYIAAGVALAFDNNDLLSVNLNLRADLKAIDPSLPESEIEIRAHYPQDISALMATVKDGQPITYKAGYDGDMSETRKFYLDGQATWEKNVLTIKGVDSVGRLDKEIFPFFIGQGYVPDGRYTSVSNNAFMHLYVAFCDVLELGGVEFINREEYLAGIDSNINGSSEYYQNSLIKRQPIRDVIANFMNVIRFTFAEGKYNGTTSFWPLFVDAGRPVVSWTRPGIRWNIYERDCGDMIVNVDRKIGTLTAIGATVKKTGESWLDIAGMSTAFKEGGVARTYNEYAERHQWKIKDSTSFLFTSTFGAPDMPLKSRWNGYVQRCGRALYDSGTEKNKEIIDVSDMITSFKDWNENMASQWNTAISDGIITSTDTTMDLKGKWCGFIYEEKNIYAVGSPNGADIAASKTGWPGIVVTQQSNGLTKDRLLPELGLKNIVNRSTETGSFTWKGDPRMQPRDFFNFHRLDGNVEVCTIESIDLKHEKGGTVATISYRKGMV